MFNRKKFLTLVLGSALMLNVLPTYAVDAISSASEKPKPPVDVKIESKEDVKGVKTPVQISEKSYLTAYDIVRKGDTLAKIAKRQGLTVDALLLLNPNLKANSVLQVGEKLIVKQTDKALVKVFEDGTYKGRYEDEDSIIALTLQLKNHKVKKIYFQSFTIAGVDYLKSTTDTAAHEIFKQYKGLIGFVYGRSVDEVNRVSVPEAIVKDRVFKANVLKSADLKGNFLWKAIENALEKGVVNE